MCTSGTGGKSTTIIGLVTASLLAACSGSEVAAPLNSEHPLLLRSREASANRSPNRSVTDISRGPLVLFRCDGFDAIATFYGTIATTVFYDANGQAVRLINQYNTNSVISNSVTGRRIFGSSRGPDIVTLEPNGAELVASSGLITNFRADDGTHLIFATGRVVQRYHPDGSVETLFTAGPIDAYLGSRRTQICNALAG